MFTPQSPHTQLAWEVISTYTRGGNIDAIMQRKPHPELQDTLACFVTLHLHDGGLRGCIGTLEPVKDNLHKEIVSNAVAAITRDTRFEPLKADELDNINVSVDVLSQPEPVEDLNLLDPDKYGVIVADNGMRKGLLLPNIEGIETVEKQLKIAKKKAGLEYTDNNLLRISRFTSTRYH